MKLIVIFFVLVGAFVVWVQPHQPIARPPGILVTGAPEQTPTIGENRSIAMGDWTLNLLYHYTVEARVIAKKRYRYDATSDISPFDLILGWGPMSDSAVLRQMKFEQKSRFGHWEYGPNISLSPAEITLHASNNHLIPANESVSTRLAALKVGEIVLIRGKLVEARKKGQEIKPWSSSLVRTDEGRGACEIIYVETVASR